MRTDDPPHPEDTVSGDAVSEISTQIRGMVLDLLGEFSELPEGGVTGDTRLDGDLFLESVELAELGEAVRRRYGGRIDLVGHVAGLDLDGIIALTVADVAAYVAGCAGSEPTGRS